MREEKSSFFPILESLLNEVQEAEAAIFSDAEGESIEFCGNMDPYDIKIIGAYAAILMPLLRTRHNSSPHTLIISCSRRTLYLRHMETYILTLVLRRRTYTAGLEEAVERAAGRFIKEAGLKAQS
jgi:hypothetical protein